jgi:hypothetical protein
MDFKFEVKVNSKNEIEVTAATDRTVLTMDEALQLGLELIRAGREVSIKSQFQAPPVKKLKEDAKPFDTSRRGH